MFDPYEDDDDEMIGLYENGHWKWDNETNELVFESDASSSDFDFNDTIPPASVFGSVEFKDDLDLMEQQKFRKRYQRKTTGDNDVIYLQDIKDYVLFTAPQHVLIPSVINILHLSSGERFIRSLILYCQYYLQTAEEMGRRTIELETKIRTKRSEQIEAELIEDMEDLRVLVGKEYVSMILGAGKYKKFHHMGPNKKRRSLSKRDIAIFESVLRLSIQIVWIALGRTSFNQLDIEVHRIFKSQFFNLIEHKLNTNYVARMAPNERAVLLGECLQHHQKLKSKSPLVNELLCHRPMDYRLLGLASIKFHSLTPRLRYMEEVLSLNECLFRDKNVVLGILGLQRSRFDPMLREIKIVTTSSASSASFRGRSSSRMSRLSIKKSTKIIEKLYPNIDLPREEYQTTKLPSEFPTGNKVSRRSNEVQRMKWMARANYLNRKRFTPHTVQRIKRQ